MTGENYARAERVPATGTHYFVHAEPIFGSPRWRFVISADGATGPVVVTASSGTYTRAEAARAAGVSYAHKMARQLRKDLAR